MSLRSILRPRGGMVSVSDNRIRSGSELSFEMRVSSFSRSFRKHKQAVVAVDVEVEKHKATSDKLELKASLYDTAGKKVAQRRVRVADGKEGIAKQSLDLKVSKPHRWNLDNPYLYTLKTELLANGKRIDGSETKVGLRTLEFDANKGFALNGNWMKVKGVCLHHDAGVLGAVVPPEVWERRLNNLKGIGVNAIRMSHNPQARWRSCRPSQAGTRA